MALQLTPFNPQDMQFLSLSTSFAIDECPAIHPDILASHPAARYEGHLKDVIDHIAQSQEHSIRHDAVPVSSSTAPFVSEESHNIFVDVLQHLHESQFLPENTLVYEDEWGEEGYPIYKTLYGDTKGKKAIKLELPLEIWLPRARLWVQALIAMRHVLAFESL